MNKIKHALAALLVVAAGFMPLAVRGAEVVKIESSLDVANVTQGHTQYVKSVSAIGNDVVKVQLYIHNTELDNSNKIATGIHAKVNIPQNVAGKTQTLTSTVRGTNTNTVNDSATITVPSDESFLTYVTGSASWRHNTGTNANPTYVDSPLGDEVVNGNGVDLGDLKPCHNFENYITVLVKIKAPILNVVKTVRIAGSGSGFVTNNEAKIGDTLQYEITVKNVGDVVAKHVVVADNMPAHMTYVPGTTYLMNSNTNQQNKLQPDGITTEGVLVDDLAPGASEKMYLKLKFDADAPCGDYKNVGWAQSNGSNQIYNLAITKLTGCVTTTIVTPTPTPTPTPTTTPTNLPQTGAEGMAGLAGLGTLGYATSAYLRSKKSLIAALKK